MQALNLLQFLPVKWVHKDVFVIVVLINFLQSSLLPMVLTTPSSPHESPFGPHHYRLSFFNIQSPFHPLHQLVFLQSFCTKLSANESLNRVPFSKSDRQVSRYVNKMLKNFGLLLFGIFALLSAVLAFPYGTAHSQCEAHEYPSHTNKFRRPIDLFSK